MHINPTTTPIDNFHIPTLLIKVVTTCSQIAFILLYVLAAFGLGQFVVQQESKISFMRALVAAKKADLMPCIYILPCRLTRCTWFSFVSVNSSNAVDKREQPPRKDGCSLFHVNARLRRKKMERRLQEKQIPIGLLSKQVVLQVGEAVYFAPLSPRKR